MDNKRKLNMSFSKSGSGSMYTRISLPITWVRDMGLTQEDKTVVVEYDEHNQTITIKKYDEFADNEL
ncbi:MULTISPECIES: AbrB/MazE/SpoVT family DNA-binding domain-containing protein [unclassified Clostridioides]|uniref:AbrB/MazE/SpoVT family DNA-binding domain-containing protein n=1 Tax=unclassified Clostridioides TaxID=2635829 RepID=UPI001D121EDC|nr:AbrB/MazE/SpoVT family DNA-binding domain-containing protein [Clostridioides sp. ES-S-0049-03]MCC0678408.1 AbrB/MazE/SpoVT family DNA-binding domain-containing protein [Clostridioides sp. ES-W-0018-02]MCC0682544.1 AbrB/MazE/SpoVT family DNA-binding domain-containing protein [Clostridioides sp. ES-S-0005-03]MCC0713235.1 AbrB/MazE/SpoVT family DNA-binding domain-containing protein [Clostridioides sp. ES-W-0017-02]